MLAGFGRRFAGHLIDTSLLLIPLTLIIVASVLAAVRAPECSSDPASCISDARWLSGPWPVVLFSAIPFIYWAAWDSIGTSPGRWLVGVRIVTSNGASPGIVRGCGRALVSNLASEKLLFLGYLWSLGDRERRTWHDHAAGTWAVRK